MLHRLLPNCCTHSPRHPAQASEIAEQLLRPDQAHEPADSQSQRNVSDAAQLRVGKYQPPLSLVGSAPEPGAAARCVRLLSMLMRDQLRDAVTASLQEYAAFWAQLRADGDEPAAEDVDTPQPPPFFSVRLAVEGGQVRPWASGGMAGGGGLYTGAQGPMYAGAS